MVKMSAYCVMEGKTQAAQPPTIAEQVDDSSSVGFTESVLSDAKSQFGKLGGGKQVQM